MLPERYNNVSCICADWLSCWWIGWKNNFLFTDSTGFVFNCHWTTWQFWTALSSWHVKLAERFNKIWHSFYWSKWRNISATKFICQALFICQWTDAKWVFISDQKLFHTYTKDLIYCFDYPREYILLTIRKIILTKTRIQQQRKFFLKKSHETEKNGLFRWRTWNFQVICILRSQLWKKYTILQKSLTLN